MEKRYALEVKHVERGQVRIWEGQNKWLGRFLARTIFNGLKALSVCVHDAKGNSVFYMKKMPDGSIYVEK